MTLITTPATAAHDWDQVYDRVHNNNDLKCTTLGGIACDFITRPNTGTVNDCSVGQNTTFTGGSSDLETVGEWHWANQSSPDADEINNVAAIKYDHKATGGHQFLFFMMDRYSVGGSKDVGFWFFKQQVSANASCTFTGAHTAHSGPNSGDILLLTTFTQGGAASSIRVYEWVGSNGSDGTLNLINTFGDCAAGGGGGDGCSTVANSSTNTGGWIYTAKPSGASANVEYAGGFMEGGIDLTALHLEGCFASFMGTSRSSPQLTAENKAFTLGNFESCGATVQTTPVDTTANHNPLTNHGGDASLPDVSIGAGSVQVQDKAALAVTGTSDFTGTMSFFICGPIASGTCTTANGGVPHGSGAANANGNYFSTPATLTSAGRYCWRAQWSSTTPGLTAGASDSSATECFEVLPVAPSLTTHAVEILSLLSPRIFKGLADLNGDGNLNTGTDPTPDNGQVFYGDTSIIGGKLDCNTWNSQAQPQNAGTAGDGVINGSDDCTLVGVDGTADGVTIGVVDGSFATIDGAPIPDGTPLPTKFKYPAVTSSTVAAADFAWSTQLGRVDANGDGSIAGDDCSNNLVNTLDVLGSVCGNTIPQGNGLVDVNNDGQITSGDSCTSGCFLGHNVSDGYVLAGAVDFGSPVTDIVSLTGLAKEPGSNGGINGTYTSIDASNGAYAGTITFTLFGPSDNGCGSQTSGGTGTNPQSVLVDTSVGNKQYGPVSYTPALPGTYHWKATIDNTPTPPNPPASVNNSLPVTDNDSCNLSREDVVVRQIPTTITSHQSAYPNDSATVTSTAVGDNIPAGGVITFKLYGPAGGQTALQNCLAHGDTLLAGRLYSESHTITAAESNHSVTAATSDTSVSVDVSETYYWRVTYSTGDSTHTGRQSDCVENTVLTFNNDSGPGTVFP